MMTPARWLARMGAAVLLALLVAGRPSPRAR